MPYWDCRTKTLVPDPMTETMMEKLAARKRVEAILRPLETPNPPEMSRRRYGQQVGVVAAGGYSTGRRTQ